MKTLRPIALPLAGLAAVTAMSLLLACRAAQSTAPAPQAPAAPAPLPADAAPEAVVPGVSLEGLTPEQKAALAEWARGTFCYCGCPHTISECLRGHAGCHHAGRAATLAARLAGQGAQLADLRKLLEDYYASFDRRFRFDVAEFGPPLGDPAAKVAIVEFSDFTCPFCRQLRPALEAWIQSRAGRVKLFYKPFPIEGHPNALEAAEAGEWARDHGVFWPMHDAMFMNPDHTPDVLADLARTAGQDEADLRDALSSHRYLSKVRASQAEARAAGLHGTPTLYLNGRHHLLDYSPESLDRSLEDEEEWVAHQGWERD